MNHDRRLDLIRERLGGADDRAPGVDPIGYCLTDLESFDLLAEVVARVEATGLIDWANYDPELFAKLVADDPVATKLEEQLAARLAARSERDG